MPETRNSEEKVTAFWKLAKLSTNSTDLASLLTANCLNYRIYICYINTMPGKTGGTTLLAAWFHKNDVNLLNIM